MPITALTAGLRAPQVAFHDADLVRALPIARAGIVLPKGGPKGRTSGEMAAVSKAERTNPAGVPVRRLARHRKSCLYQPEKQPGPPNLIGASSCTLSGCTLRFIGRAIPISIDG